MNVAKETAQRVLLEHGCAELPVKVYPISIANGVKVKLSAPNAMRDRGGGIVLAIGQKVYILVDPGYSYEYQHFTAAHELGHILRGHVGSWQWVSEDGAAHVVTGRTISYSRMEQEADAFADELLMPECVLMLCGAETPEEIALLCKTLPEDAEPVAERIRQRKRSGQPLTLTELQIVRQFAGYIQRTCAVTC